MMVRDRKRSNFEVVQAFAQKGKHGLVCEAEDGDGGVTILLEEMADLKAKQ